MLLETAIWAFVVLVLVGTGMWRADRLLRSYIKPREVSVGEQEVVLKERHTAAEIAQRTVDEAVVLRKAELRQQTVEAEVAASMEEELRPDRLAAEKEKIAADVEAHKALAEEFAAAEHAAQIGEGGDIVDRYGQYMAITADRGASYMSFDDFVAVIRQVR